MKVAVMTGIVGVAAIMLTVIVMVTVMLIYRWPY